MKILKNVLLMESNVSLLELGWVKDGNLSLHRWWNTLDHLIEAPSIYEKQVEQLHALFLDACRIRMRSDVAIGTALSGGLDSSATISAMAHIGHHERGERISDDGNMLLWPVFQIHR